MAELSIRSELIPKTITTKLGGSNKFTLPEIPEPGTLQVFRNGVVTREGINKDYVLNNETITIRFIITNRTLLTFRYFVRKVLNEF